MPATVEERTRKSVRGNSTAGFPLKRAVHLLIAGFFFVLGVLGAVLPGLPATPFLLLTSYFLARSSPRLNDRLLRSRFLGPILRDWQDHGGVRTDVKIRAIVLITLMVAATLCFSSLPHVGKMIIAALALCGIAVVFKLPVVES